MERSNKIRDQAFKQDRHQRIEEKKGSRYIRYPWQVRKRNAASNSRTRGYWTIALCYHAPHLVLSRAQTIDADPNSPSTFLAIAFAPSASQTRSRCCLHNYWSRIRAEEQGGEPTAVAGEHWDGLTWRFKKSGRSRIVPCQQKLCRWSKNCLELPTSLKYKMYVGEDVSLQYYA